MTVVYFKVENNSCTNRILIDSESQDQIPEGCFEETEEWVGMSIGATNIDIETKTFDPFVAEEPIEEIIPDVDSLSDEELETMMIGLGN